MFLKDPLDDNSVIDLLETRTYQDLLNKKIISEGMLPKLHNCFYALEHAVSEVYLGGPNLLQKGALHTKIIK